MKEEKIRLPAHKPDSSYNVGYCKPPQSTRFKPGQSGNPRGRPKGAKNKLPRLNEEPLKSIILGEAYRDITVRDGTRAVTIPMAQAIIRSLAVNAAKGEHRAQRLFAEMLSTTERQNKQLADEWLSTAMDYKINWDEELDRRARLGITDLPDPVPHPDHVKIDMNTGQAWVAGPMTKEEVAELEMWRAKRVEWQVQVTELRADLEVEEDQGIRQIIRDEITHTEQVLAIIDRALSAVD
ncbi:hypothetical protein DDZ14_18825 [Maritimibacter sp. 55A14]|uniref:DUF5681 domain-containing protein n=1 Tax=Maritimibacter sp. 55A14 TaxID=2174844 RepID=UPI000D60E441|nr:DUF5681 domain-containing protein [Maritimibacter sp. 55A14]PWE28761.1 hypothetical protein DDZ14_18825 [Maritimibacter sp. 55A14]